MYVIYHTRAVYSMAHLQAFSYVNSSRSRAKPSKFKKSAMHRSCKQKKTDFKRKSQVGLEVVFMPASWKCSSRKREEEVETKDGWREG